MKRDSSIVVSVGGNNLKFPWAGGLNFTNWGTIDLDGDGFKDLAVYDKSGGIIRTFINDKITGQASFTHNPKYQSGWPPISSWFVLHDYNCDGKEDIFTYSNNCGGMKVYRNNSTAGNLQFVEVAPYNASCLNYLLMSDYTPIGNPGYFNIPVSTAGLPGLYDIDGDGDMDIIVFSAPGSNIEFHQNQSVQMGHGCDSLIFKAFDNCWGDLNESTCTVSLNVCPGGPVMKQLNKMTERINHHAGSCLMCFDADGNSLMDVLLGDISCDTMILLHNGGLMSDANINSYTNHYPATHPASVNNFPCSYFIDVNNDGKRDMIAAPSMQGSLNVNNQLLYTNTNTDNSPTFNYTKNNFIQESMIDVGEGAFPALFDYEGDGDLDLLVGNFGYYGVPNYSSKIAFFLNTGTATAPSFSLVTNDYSGFSSTGALNLAPTSGDLDGDGDQDLIVGNNLGEFYYFENTAGGGNPAVFSSVPTSSYGNGFLANIRAGSVKAYPQLIDLDKDGKLDLIAGNQAGKIYYFHNIGTITSPSFSTTPTSTALGGVNVLQSNCSNVGNNMPFVFSYNGSYRMLVGSECGNMYLYDSIDNHLSGNFHLINSNAYGIVEGEHTAPILYDLNGDGNLDLMIGNYGGGLGFYKGLSTAYNYINEIIYSGEISVYPNPANDILNIKFNSFNMDDKKEVEILDITGSLVKEFKSKDNQISLDVSNLSGGLYFLQVRMFDDHALLHNTYVRKVIIKK